MDKSAPVTTGTISETVTTGPTTGLTGWAAGPKVLRRQPIDRGGNRRDDHRYSLFVLLFVDHHYGSGRVGSVR